MNSQANQRFGTLDLITMVVLCGLVSSAVGASIAGFMHDTRPVKAKSAAEALALQLRAQHENAVSAAQATPSGDRAPASVDVPPLTDGQIGKDPWGRPFHYSVMGSHRDSNPPIIVWSEGPNGKLDSDIAELEIQMPEKFRFKGDDVGFVYYASRTP